MRILVVEDEFVSRKYLTAVLKNYGDCDVAVDGNEAVEAFRAALDEGQPYALVLLDIMMPNKDGHQALKEIRAIEKERGILAPAEAKVVMATALSDPRNVVKAYYEGGATAYLSKPIETQRLIATLKELGLVG